MPLCRLSRSAVKGSLVSFSRIASLRFSYTAAQKALSLQPFPAFYARVFFLSELILIAKKIYNIVSYGGGTQSTALILMSLNGYKNLNRPDFGVYSDTGSEPEFVNNYIDFFIDYVKNAFDFDIFRTMKGAGLYNHLQNPPIKSKLGNFYISSVPPFFTLNEFNEVGMLMRQCTSDFKTKPLSKLINSLIPRGSKYIKWIGISFDERSRMKISQTKKFTNYYPLVDLFINRADSINYLNSLNFRPAQRSSCFFCPFHSNNYWRWLKKFHYKEFDKAVQLEKTVNQNSTDYTTSEYFLHKSCITLDKVNFDDPTQLSLFPELIDECNAECGI